jgi:hypothetical protein
MPGHAGSHARGAGELSQRLAEERRKAAMPAEQIARDIERRRLRIACAQHDGDQFGVGERVRAVGKQALTRTFAGGPVGDARHASRIRIVRRYRSVRTRIAETLRRSLFCSTAGQLRELDCRTVARTRRYLFDHGNVRYAL